MTEIDRVQLLTALQNGLGFSASCELNLLSPETVTKFMRDNNDFHIGCINAIKSAARGNLEHAQELKNKKKWDQWHKQQEIIKNFVVELTLWEEYSSKKDITVHKIIRATHIYKSIEECATACGFTRREFVEYVMDNVTLAMHLAERGVYNF